MDRGGDSKRNELEFVEFFLSYSRADLHIGQELINEIALISTQARLFFNHYFCPTLQPAALWRTDVPFPSETRISFCSLD
jgi:hypothetical protein